MNSGSLLIFLAIIPGNRKIPGNPETTSLSDGGSPVGNPGISINARTFCSMNDVEKWPKAEAPAR
jgi:hypothetical protein